MRRLRGAVLLAVLIVTAACADSSGAGRASIKIASWNIEWLTRRPPDERGVPRRGESDFARRRADVIVRVGGEPLRLLSVHLEAGCREGRHRDFVDHVVPGGAARCSRIMAHSRSCSRRRLRAAGPEPGGRLVHNHDSRAGGRT